MSSQLVTTSLVDGVLTVTIARPEARNSLNASVVQSLIKALSTATKSDTSKVIVLTGEGTEAFCAGADLKELYESTPQAKKGFFSDIGKLITVMSKCPKPIIAKVHGYALAGGCGLVGASDIVIASEDATFGLPEIHIGLVPMVVMVPLARVVEKRALTNMILTGENIDATTALRIGLVTKVCSKTSLDETVDQVARKLAKKSSSAILAAKKALFDVSEKSYAKTLRDFSERVGKLSNSPDAKEGMKAFIEKRVPVWSK